MAHGSAPEPRSVSAAVNEDGGGSFWDHLAELRRRLLRMLAVFGAGLVLAYVVSPRLLSFLARPVGSLYFFAPAEAFLVRLKVAALAALLVTLPYHHWELWQFLKPALLPRERRPAWLFWWTALLLFYLGAAFALFLGIPVGLRVLLSFGGPGLQALLRAGDYVNFALLLVLAFGGLFEFPLLVVALTLLGLLDPAVLARHRREVIVGVFVVAAVITPSVDFVTQTLLALPLIILFEVGLWISRRFQRRST